VEAVANDFYRFAPLSSSVREGPANEMVRRNTCAGDSNCQALLSDACSKLSSRVVSKRIHYFVLVHKKLYDTCEYTVDANIRVCTTCPMALLQATSHNSRDSAHCNVFDEDCAHSANL
jgi:hypothetical protein